MMAHNRMLDFHQSQLRQMQMMTEIKKFMDRFNNNLFVIVVDEEQQKVGIKIIPSESWHQVGTDFTFENEEDATIWFTTEWRKKRPRRSK